LITPRIQTVTGLITSNVLRESAIGLAATNAMNRRQYYYRYFDRKIKF